MVEGIQERNDVVTGIYKNILKDDFGFEGVKFAGQDSHAYYFENDYTGEKVMIVNDKEQIEVFYKDFESEDWHFVNEIHDKHPFVLN